MNILENINSPSDVKSLRPEQIPELCAEIRDFLVKSVALSGGHLSSNLGTVELTVAIHRVFDSSRDRLVFDVGHQSYTHKLLTGRREGFAALRQKGGISGFPKPGESEHDAFIAGHASNAISVALGMASARTGLGGDYDVLALLGDGALTGGLAYEGLSNAGQSGEPLIVILNDNGMSIAENVGGVARFLSRQRVKSGYLSFKRVYRSVVGKIPPLYRFLHRVKSRLKQAILRCSMFEDLGFDYLGPVDGHDVVALERVLRWARGLRGPVLIHVRTIKGKGWPPAERNPDEYHGVGVYDPETGALAAPAESFSTVFGEELCRLAGENDKLLAITAAMVSGTGLNGFAEKYPGRFYDVGIAEGHAVSMAAGLSMQGMTPVFAVYSSFLQRSYDMLIHDVSLLGLHVVFAVDRAGIVGQDGETHQGVFDLAFLSSVPRMTVLAPSSFAELRGMLEMAVSGVKGPVAIRYPRGGEGEYTPGFSDAPTVVLCEGGDVTIVSHGIMINEALQAAEILEGKGYKAEIIKLNRVCPIDCAPVEASLKKTGRLVVVENVCRAGSAGERLCAALAESGAAVKARLMNLGDGVLTQGSVPGLLEMKGLLAENIAAGALTLFEDAVNVE